MNELSTDNRTRGYSQSFLPDEWSPSYVALLVYAFGMVTARFPVGTPAVVVGLICLVFSPYRFRVAPPLVYMGLLLVWSCIGYFTSDYQAVVSDELYNFLKLVLVAVLAVNAVRTRRQAQFYLIFVLGCFLIYPVRGALINFFVLDYTSFGRAIGVGLYSNSNDLAALTLMQISVALAIFVGSGKRWARWGGLCAALIMALLIVLTQSRGVFLGGLAFLALIIGAGRRKLKIFFGLIVAMGIVTMIVPASTFDRFEQLAAVISGGSSIGNADEEGSAAGRSDIYRLALMASADHPITGVGLGSYPLANEQYASKVDDISIVSRGRLDAHSTYLSILAETGIPGLIILLLLFRTVLKSVQRSRRSLLANDPQTASQLSFLFAGYIGFLIAAAVGTYTDLSMTYVHLCVLWVLAETVRQPLDSEMTNAKEKRISCEKGRHVSRFGQ